VKIIAKLAYLDSKAISKPVFIVLQLCAGVGSETGTVVGGPRLAKLALKSV